MDLPQRNLERMKTAVTERTYWYNINPTNVNLDLALIFTFAQTVCKKR